MAPVAAWAIPAAIGAVSAWVGHKDAKSAQNQQNQLMQQQQSIAGQAVPYAQQFMKQAESGIGPSMNYYTSMLANPREATAPEQNRINALYAGQGSTVRNMYPRGGYGPAAAENMRSQQRAATENTIQMGRPMAAQALGNLGANVAGLGFQGFGLGAGVLGNVFNQGLAARQQNFSQGQQMGQGLFNAYQAYLLSRASGSASTPSTLPTTGMGNLYYGNTGNQFSPSNLTPSSGSLYGGSSIPNSGASGGG